MSADRLSPAWANLADVPVLLLLATQPPHVDQNREHLPRFRAAVPRGKPGTTDTVVITGIYVTPGGDANTLTGISPRFSPTFVAPQNSRRGIRTALAAAQLATPVPGVG